MRQSISFLPHRKACLIILAFACLAGARAASAADYYNYGVSGTRLDAATNYSNTDGSTNNATVAPGASDNLFFYNSTVTGPTNIWLQLGATARTFNSMSFRSNAGTTQINRDAEGSGTGNNTVLSIGAGGITLDAGAGAVSYGKLADSGDNQRVTVGAVASFTISNNSAGDLTFNREFDARSDNTTNVITVAGSGSGNTIFAGGIKAGAPGRDLAMVIDTTGSGAVRIEGTGTYTGGTTLEQGTLQVRGSLALGTGALTINGGTLASFFLARTLANNVTVGGNFTLGGSGQGITLNGTIDLGGGTRVITTANSATLGGIISNGGITKEGGAVLTLTAVNTYTGVTTVSNGQLSLGGSGTTIAGNVTIAGGTLNYSSTTDNQIATGATMTISGGGFDLAARNQTLAAMTMSGGAVSRGGGTLMLSGASSFTGGTVTLSAGTSHIETSGETTFGAVTFTYNSTADNNNALVLGGNVVTTGSGTTVFENTTSGTPFINLGNDTRTFNIASGTDMQVGWGLRVGGITKTGEGTLVLSAGSTYSGTTTLSAGTLVISNQNALGTGNFVQTSGGTLLQVATTGTITNTMEIYNVSFTESVTLTGAKTLNNATIEVATGETVTEQGVLSGGGGLIKEGGGAYILNGSADNTYTGATVVNEGSLVLSNSSGNAINDSASITVNSGGTLVLGASNQIGDGIGLVLNGGTLLVGTSTLTESLGTLTLSASSTIDFGAYGETGFRQLTFADSSAIEWTGTLTITNWQGVAQTSSDFTQLVFGTGGLTPTQLSQVVWASQDINGGELLGGSGELAPIPEAPVVWGAAAVALFIVWRERRRLRFVFGAIRSKLG